MGGVEGVFPGGQQPQALPRQGRAEGPVRLVTAGALGAEGSQLAQGRLRQGGPGTGPLLDARPGWIQGGREEREEEL